MSLRPSVLSTVASCLVLSGCGLMQGLSPETHLADQVHQLNDEARWGRIDLAALRVGRAYRRPFIASHARWGHDVRVADADVTAVTLGEPAGGASSLVTYEWIDERRMELRRTTVRQVWEGGEMDGFRLVREEVTAGDPAIFDAVEGGPEVLDGSELLTPTSGEGGLAMTSGGEDDGSGAISSGPSGPAATTSTVVVRRDPQGLRVD